MAWQFEKLSKQTKRCFVVCAMPCQLKAGVAYVSNMHRNIRTSRMENPG